VKRDLVKGNVDGMASEVEVQVDEDGDGNTRQNWMKT